MRPEQIPYGVKDFKRVRLENFYYVDKSSFIEKMENRANFLFFVRPRRFGKSMLCEMLKCYYDIAEKENFEKLFGGLYAGAHPTENASRYFVLVLDFSRVNVFRSETWGGKFAAYMDSQLDSFITQHRALFASDERVMSCYMKPDAEAKYDAIVTSVHAQGFGLYLIIDEYDNFTNEIVSAPNKELYQAITHGTGFYRGWFKQFKATADRIFMTGVSPVTMDDLTSGFNIATNISLEAEFHAMVGFTTDEVHKLFEDFQGCKNFQDAVAPHLRTVKAWYDSYCFARKKVGVESLYNCDMALYYLSALVATGEPPEKLIDGNIRSDWKKLSMILAAQRHAETYDGVLPLTEELAEKDETTFELVDSFPIEKVCDARNFKSLYYYYGIVTMGRFHRGTLMFRIPNECVRRQIFDYMRSECEKRPNAIDTSEFIAKFNAFAWDGEWRELFTYLAEKYRDNGSPRDGIDGEARINGYLRAYLTMRSVYVVKPELSHPYGFSDYVLFPNRMQAAYAIPQQSYVIELKYAPKDAADAELAANHQAALDQLKKYAQDPNLPALAGDTPVHYLCYEFKGRDLFRLEEVDPATGETIA